MAAAADDPAGDGEDPQPLGFPAAGGAIAGEHLGPGQQLAGQQDDLAPGLVLRIAVQGQVPQLFPLAVRIRSSHQAAADAAVPGGCKIPAE